MARQPRPRQPISQKSLDEDWQKPHNASSHEPRTWSNRLQLFLALLLMGIFLLLFLFLGIRMLLFFTAPGLLQHSVLIAADAVTTYIAFALMLPFLTYVAYRALRNKPEAGQSRILHIAFAVVPLILSILLTIGYFWPNAVLTNIGTVGLLIFAFWVRFGPTAR